MSDDVFNTEHCVTIGVSGIEAADGGLGLSDVFRLLGNSRRRQLLYRLHDADVDVLGVDDLVEHVSEQEGASDDGHRRRVRVDLQHNHLPKLEGVGVAEYDRRSDAVRYWERPMLTEWLEHARWKEVERV